MDASVISGLIGGIIALIFVSLISSKVRNSSNGNQLKYGWGFLVLGWSCIAFVALAIYLLFYDLNVWEDRGELYSVIGLFIGFGAGAIYTFGEYKVWGSYDDDGIVLYTPWTGRKEEKWCDLDSVKYNSNASWYVLKFKSGRIIRLSSLLGGHGGVLDILYRKGYEF